MPMSLVDHTYKRFGWYPSEEDPQGEVWSVEPLPAEVEERTDCGSCGDQPYLVKYRVVLIQDGKPNASAWADVCQGCMNEELADADWVARSDKSAFDTTVEVEVRHA